MELHMKTLETMNFYIEAGRFLNDFDRNNNFDLKEILEFFKPNNRLFGDYEIRKKNGLEKFLDRKKRDNTPCVIPKSEIESMVPDGWLILFVISGQGLFVEYGWIKIEKDDEYNEVKIEYDDLAKGALSVDTKDIHQIYVLDPIKLKQISNLDKGRNLSFKNAILERFLGEDFGRLDINDKASWYEVIDLIVEGKQKKFTNLKIEEQILSMAPDQNIFAKILEAFNGNDELLRPLVKLKCFEEFKDVVIRLGIYEDGRYVIYLHPYKSESNCPGRIPSE